ncbi:MAG: TolC family protein [Deltaproteobacteria bacterium]|nr:TolC family protein [Deltaproteobacteria bacterium]
MKKVLMLVITGSFLLWPGGVYSSDNEVMNGGNGNKREFTLEMSIETALKNNTSIKREQERLRAAGEEVKKSIADFLPEFSTSYGYTRLHDEPFAKFGGTEFFLGKRDSYQCNFRLTQPIFTGFALKSRHQMAKLGVDIGKVATKQAILDVVKDVKVAYFSVLLAKKYFLVAEEAVEQLQSHADDADKFYQQGMIPYNDLLKSKVALADAEQSRVRAESDAKLTVSAFNTILRIDIDEDTRVADVLEFKPFDYTLDKAIEVAQKERPELLALRLSLKNMDFRVKLSKSQYYPQIALVGNCERNGEDPEASKNEFGNSHNESITLQLNWTFFEWGKTKADVAKYQYEKQALREELSGAEDFVNLEVKRAYLDLKVAKRNVGTAQESLEQAKENYRITNLQYQQQITTSTEVLDARTLLTQAETNYFGALYGYDTALAEIIRTMGRK